MPRSPTSRRKPADRAGPAAIPRSASAGSRLNPATPCDTAFRIVARRDISTLGDKHVATCAGDEDALHQMRVALTRLRTCILFFSPMVEDPHRSHIRDELKWLNRQLGMVRDLDVAIGRIEATSEARDLPLFASWKDKRTQGHRALTRILQSARYRRLIESTSKWIESGSWSTRTDEDAERARTAPILVYALHKLSRWEARLLKKSRKLYKTGREEAAPPATSQQEAELCDRILPGSVRGQEVRQAGDRTEASAQGAALSRAIERRCPRAGACAGAASGWRNDARAAP